MRLTLITAAMIAFLIAPDQAHIVTQLNKAAAEYQEELIAGTVHLRPEPHSYAGYSGPWLENYFMKEWSRREGTLARIYVPIAWTDCLLKGSLRDQVQKVLDSLDTAFTYFSVCQLDLAFDHPQLRLEVPQDVDFVLYSAGGASSVNARGLWKVVPVPLLKEELSPIGLVKNIAVSSQGSITHPLRQALYDTYHKKFLFLSNNKDWRTVLESSHFALCPRGFGHTSFRMYETIQLGTLPIYVWEGVKWLPYQELINWESFAIITEGSDIASLGDKIRAADTAAMQAALNKYKHMFTYNFTVQYIQNHISHLDTSSPSQVK